MPERPAHTLLLIKSDVLARADFGPSPDFAPLGFWQQSQPANVRLYHSIETALSMGGKPGRAVWVIGETFWTQALSLPAKAIAGLTRDQIAKSIAYDVEALTGLSATDSTLGFCQAAPTDDLEHLWVTQVSLSARTQIQDAVEKAGGTLGGIVHPGGSRGPLDSNGDAAASWRRVEVWKDVTLCLIGVGTEPQRVTVINGDPAQEAWRANVTGWINANDAAHSEWLGPQGEMADDLAHTDGRPWKILPPLSGDSLKQWIARWAAELVDTPTAAPVIEPTRVNKLPVRQILAMAGITLVCLAACAARGYWLWERRLSLQHSHAVLATRSASESAQLRMLQAPKMQWDQLQTQIKTIRTEQQKLRGQHAASNFHGVPNFAMQRHSVAGLLTELGINSATDLAIDKIKPDGNGDMLIEGRCLPNTSVDNFAGALATALPAVGWQVSPAEKKLAGQIPSGDFILRVSPLLPSTNLDTTDEIIPSSAAAMGGK